MEPCCAGWYINLVKKKTTGIFEIDVFILGFKYVCDYEVKVCTCQITEVGHAEFLEIGKCEGITLGAEGVPFTLLQANLVVHRF